MSPVTEKIEEAFKKLAPREQARTLNRLKSVVYGEESPAFIAMLKRCVEEITSGNVKGIPAEKIFKKLKKKYA